MNSPVLRQIEFVNFTSEEDRDTKRPIRQCALLRSPSREDELLRFVLDPESRVVPDIKRKLPGRGVWITASYEAVASSVRRKVLARGFKQPVTVSPDLADLVAELLRRAALQDLAFANKAGCVVAGYAKVERALKGAGRFFLVHASDASQDGCRKLDRQRRASQTSETKDLDPIACFASAELSAALGKSNVNHAAIADGGAGRTFLRSANRYKNYLGTHPAAGSVQDTPEQDKA
jgi:hypothetical protein